MTRFLSLLAVCGLGLAAQTLDIYWVDVEGGAATLIKAPTGESLLIDTGFPGQGDRDAQRIVAAAKAAGLSRIDTLVITHYHVDHVGGVAPLAKLIPIGRFVDHGETVEGAGRGGQSYNEYAMLVEGKRTIVKAGDKLTFARGIDVAVVSAAGKVLPQSQGGAASELCASAESKPEDKTENAQSVGLIFTYGRFKLAALGDLTWDREMQLACPRNLIGEVSIFQATHHGFSNGQSGAPALVHALQPQVVIVNNGARKGFSNGGYETIAAIPRIEGIWQGHRGEGNDAAHNTSEDMIANPAAQGDEGHWIKASIAADGTYTVTNGRNNFSKTYKAR